MIGGDIAPAGGGWRTDKATRRWALAAIVYLVATAVYFICADPARLFDSTRYNHFALQAAAWLSGRFDLGGPPPAHAGGNDFALYHGRWYVVFPPFPALLLVPLVAAAGGASRVPDGQFFVWLAGLGPAFLFLALERLRRSGRSTSDVKVNVGLALLFAFGTVYFFTAEQGTVWYAAHVVAVALGALYLLWSVDAAHPWLAGVALGLGFLTRPPLVFAFPLFVAEVWRVTGPDPGSGNLAGRLTAFWQGPHRGRALRLLAACFVPLGCAWTLAFAYNAVRFADPFDYGYHYLTIAWQGRIQRWGLFHYHYLARNLAVLLTSLPWAPAPGSGAPFQINGHGLALWVTSPFLLWLARPRDTGDLWRALWLTVAAVALPSLLYQNTGWVQFGYRFSNDYSVFLFALLAVGRVWEARGFWIAAAIGVLVNGFGAISFDRPAWDHFYFLERTQTVLFQPD